jgi:hypothetical protein
MPAHAEVRAPRGGAKRNRLFGRRPCARPCADHTDCRPRTLRAIQTAPQRRGLAVGIGRAPRVGGDHVVVLDDGSRGDGDLDGEGARQRVRGHRPALHRCCPGPEREVDDDRIVQANGALVQPWGPHHPDLGWRQRVGDHDGIEQADRLAAVVGIGGPALAQLRGHPGVFARARANAVWGTVGNTGRVYLYTGQGANSYFGVNTANPYATVGTVANNLGLYVANRSSSSAVQGYKNGSSLVSNAADNSIVVPTSNFAFGLGDGTFSSEQFMLAGFGSSLSSTDVTNLYSRSHTLLQTIAGVP